MQPDDDDGQSYSDLVHYQYCKNGNRGKPITAIGEWTHLAGIVGRKRNGKKQCLTLATGTKCLGASAVSNEGYSINDSHAEVLARRAFISFMYAEIVAVISGQFSEWIEFEGDLFNVRSEVSFHLYCSHTPCGDASIIPADSDVSPGNACTSQESINDIFRTGAKCTESGPQDLLLPGTDYHITGAFRIKPGRGERTLSMSCSDKLAKWTVTGIQGSLLVSFFQKPIYLTSVIVGPCPFSEAAMLRTVYERNCCFNSASSLYTFHKPKFLQFINAQSEAAFRDSNSPKPSPLAIVWHSRMEKPEVLVDGYRQGASANRRNLPKTHSWVCRRHLCDKYIEMQLLLRERNNNDQCSYFSLKRTAAPEYHKVWANLRRHYSYWINDSRKETAQSFLI